MPSTGPSTTSCCCSGIRNAIESGSFDSQLFLHESDTITWVEDFSGAWAPWPFVGLTVNVDYLNPRKTGAASYSQNGMRAAAMADFDARPLLEWLPVGLNVAYCDHGPVGSGGLTTTQDFGFGAYYTGSRDLALGVEVDWESGTLESPMLRRRLSPGSRLLAATGECQRGKGTTSAVAGR